MLVAQEWQLASTRASMLLALLATFCGAFWVLALFAGSGPTRCCNATWRRAGLAFCGQPIEAPGAAGLCRDAGHLRTVIFVARDAVHLGTVAFLDASLRVRLRLVSAEIGNRSFKDQERYTRQGVARSGAPREEASPPLIWSSRARTA